MSLPAIVKLTPPARLLYRGLRRLGSHFDKYALLKAFYIDNESRYVPTKSFEIEIRKAFREAGNLNEAKFNETLTEGFCSYRYLNTLLEDVEIKKPWYRKVTSQFIESKLARDLNFKTCQLPCVTVDIKAGTILVAHPQFRNDIYAQTVILILRHDRAGTTGVILDRDLPTDDPNITYWNGGPTPTDNNLILLHTNTVQSQSQRQISTNLYYSYVNKKQIQTFIRGTDASQFRIFNTLSEWSPGQLQMELSTGHWFLVSCPDDILFEKERGGGGVSTLKQIGDASVKITEIVEQQQTPFLSSSQEKPASPSLPSESGAASPITTAITTITSCVLDLSDTTKNKFGYSLWKKVLRLLGGEYAAFSFVDGITDNPAIVEDEQ